MIAVVTVLAWFDLTADDGGFVAGNGAQWQYGEATKGPDTVGWATRLDRPYLNDSVDTLEIPLPDLGGRSRPRLVLAHAWSFDAGDVGRLEVDDGNGWRPLTPTYATEPAIRGDSGGLVESAWWLDGLPDGARARLVFVSDVAGADDGWFVVGARVVDGDAVAPHITPVTVPTDTQDYLAASAVVVAAEDDVALSRVELVWSVDGGPEARAAMVDQGDGTWRGEIPPPGVGARVDWRVEAADADNVARWPAGTDGTYRVYLAAPTAVVGPSGRVIGDDATLAWTAPDTPWPVRGYVVSEAGDDTLLAETTGLAASVPLQAPSPSTFVVRAVYDAGLGDPSAPVSVDGEIPTLRAVAPATVRAGDARRITLTGDALYADAATVVDFGDDTEVLDLRVADVGRVDAVVRFAATATPGPRSVGVAGAWGEAVFEEALVVEGAADPALVASAVALPQGWSGEVTVRAAEPFAGRLHRVDDDVAIVANPIGDAGATEARLAVAIARDAAPGEHPLWYDDGARWWVYQLTVVEAVDTGRSCAPPGHLTPGWAAAGGVAMLVGLRRRRR